MAFKRKRVYAPRRSGGKRRRFARRGRRFKGVTSKSGTGSTFGFRAKKLSRSAWKRKLWDATLFSTHYRTNNAVKVAQNTNANAAVYTTVIAPAMRLGNNQFFSAAGGAIGPDGTLPTFMGNIVIRGGTLGLSCFNEDSGNTTKRVTVFLLKTSMGWTGNDIPANPIIGFDPTIIRDFQEEIGRIVMRRSFLLENNSTMDLKFRLPIHKIDVSTYAVDRNSYVWVILVNDVEGATTAVGITPYYNMSFVADADLDT